MAVYSKDPNEIKQHSLYKPKDVVRHNSPEQHYQELFRLARTQNRAQKWIETYFEELCQPHSESHISLLILYNPKEIILNTNEDQVRKVHDAEYPQNNCLRELVVDLPFGLSYIGHESDEFADIFMRGSNDAIDRFLRQLSISLEFVGDDNFVVRCGTHEVLYNSHNTQETTHSRSGSIELEPGDEINWSQSPFLTITRLK